MAAMGIAVASTSSHLFKPNSPLKNQKKKKNMLPIGSLIIETVKADTTSDDTNSVARRLILLRHARSSWDNPSRRDHDRPLSKSGEADAIQVSCKLQQLGWLPQLILSSFYSIAAMDGQTAQHLQNKICQYSGDDIRTIMCMGHNRGWEEAASMLSGARVELKTCNAALLGSTGKSWEEAFSVGLGGWKLHGIVKPDNNA